MKHTLLQATALIFVLLFSASCNDSEDAPPAPTPSFLISGQTIDPMTGASSAWATNSVTARLDSVGFFVKAVRGSDTLSIAIEGIDTLMYPITGSSMLSSFNKYQTVPTDGFGFYSFKADGSGGGILNITKHDTVNRTFSGDLFVQYFNPINNSDFFELSNATLANIPYTVIMPDAGGGTGGGGGGGTGGGGPIVGNMNYTIDGTEYVITTATGVSSGGILALSGANPPLGNPTLAINMNGLIESGTYSFDNGLGASASVLQGSSDFFVASTGSMEILTHDTAANTITGNFNFMATSFQGGDNLDVTSGSFDLEYMEIE